MSDDDLGGSPGADGRDDARAPRDADTTSRTDRVLGVLRQRRTPVLLLRGFGPLVLAAVLGLLMMLLAPSVAPERIVERPVTVGTDVDG